MKPICEMIQSRLAGGGPEALGSDPDARRHLAECKACSRFVEVLSQLDDGLGAMPALDAPDDVVDRLLARPERRTLPIWAGVAAAVLVLIAAPALLMRDQPTRGLPDEIAVTKNRETAHAPPAGSTGPAALGDEKPGTPEVEELRGYLGKGDVEVQEPAQARVKVTASRDVIDLDRIEPASEFSDKFITDLEVPGRSYSNVLTDTPAPVPTYDEALTMAPGVQDADGNANPNVHGSRSHDFRSEVAGVNSIEEMELVAKEAEEDGRKRQNKNEAGKDDKQLRETALPGNAPELIADSRVEPAYPDVARAARLEATVVLRIKVQTDGTVADDVEVLSCTRSGLGFEQAAIDAVRQWRYEPGAEVQHTITLDFRLENSNDQGRARRPADDAERAARDFLAERASLGGLRFEDATGYWSNTYVPGDPALRLLEARLSGEALRAHDVSRPAAQPFDAPLDSAMAVYLHADHSGVSGPGRMLVQVGLRGTPRHGGRRPAMNLALVLDMRGEVPDELAIGLRALLESFNEAREPGDRFRVLVAGRPGGLVVESDDFRHGYLKVTLDRLLDDPTAGPTLTLVEAMSRAIQHVAAADDSDLPLGSSAVVLVTGQPLGAETDPLVDLAHQSAVAGVPVSVVGVGDRVELTRMDRVTLAGQGHRRLLDNAGRAAEIVDRELSAASRAIARAVRLRIRLAPGVELIDVLGSERLDDRRAQQVRQAERSLDLRLSRNLGIEADRGEDEEGIQIVIPSFYADDSHVILLDVAVPGPGAIADVTMRYKDLVYLRNGVARANLSIDNRERAAGPLERNVLKNLLSVRLSRALDAAGDAVAAADPRSARRLLGDHRALLTGLGLQLPGVANDADVVADIAMLDDYEALLASATAGGIELAHLADSLRYAALLKLLPRPLETRS